MTAMICRKRDSPWRRPTIGVANSVVLAMMTSMIFGVGATFPMLGHIAKPYLWWASGKSIQRVDTENFIGVFFFEIWKGVWCRISSISTSDIGDIVIAKVVSFFFGRKIETVFFPVIQSCSCWWHFHTFSKAKQKNACVFIPSFRLVSLCLPAQN